MKRLNKKENFRVPKNYLSDFNKKIYLNSGIKENFIVPEGYFNKLTLSKINSKNKSVFKIRAISTVAASLIFLFFSYNMFIKSDQLDSFDENLLIFNDYDIYNSLYYDDISANELIDNVKSYDYLISTMTYEDDLLILD
tara:strand:- start:2543 stop:2959 length:417 start_codon:yes stop_codon:yes gene_type:complete